MPMSPETTTLINMLDQGTTPIDMSKDEMIQLLHAEVRRHIVEAGQPRLPNGWERTNSFATPRVYTGGESLYVFLHRALANDAMCLLEHQATGAFIVVHQDDVDVVETMLDRTDEQREIMDLRAALYDAVSVLQHYPSGKDDGSWLQQREAVLTGEQTARIDNELKDLQHEITVGTEEAKKWIGERANGLVVADLVRLVAEAKDESHQFEVRELTRQIDELTNAHSSLLNTERKLRERLRESEELTQAHRSALEVLKNRLADDRARPHRPGQLRAVRRVEVKPPPAGQEDVIVYELIHSEHRTTGGPPTLSCRGSFFTRSEAEGWETPNDRIEPRVVSLAKMAEDVAFTKLTTTEWLVLQHHFGFVDKNKPVLAPDRSGDGKDKGTH